LVREPRSHGSMKGSGMVGDTVSEKEERRRWTRIPAEHLVSYTHFDEQMTPDDMGVARTLDLSEGGILMEMTRDLEEGSPLEIKMVSGDHTLRARGRIVHSQRLSSGRWRVGLDFTDIAEGDLIAIAQEVVRSQEMGGSA
jgi:c-di-GMP-binding flagellar brake protein YcgR